MANPFLFFLRCVILSWFNAKKEKMAVSDLFNKFSYRYPLKDIRSAVGPLRYLKMSLALLFKTRVASLKKNGDVFGFGGVAVTAADWQEYLELNAGVKTTFMFRNALYNELTVLEKIINMFYLFFLTACIWPVSFFYNDRTKVSLILLELTEALLLSRSLKKFDAKELYIVSAYEKDVVFLSYFLKKKLHLKINILPSSNPITLLYKKVICDTFIFTAPFQEMEYEGLKKDWILTDTQLWPPNGFNTITLNKAPQTTGNPYVVGLVSSGMALRNFLGHTNLSNNHDFLAETSLITALKKLQDETTLIDKLIIYLHPLEKSTPQNIEFSTNYYKGIFSQFEFAPFDIPSKKVFGLCTVALSGFSSAQIERLYAGYKTIFAPMGFLGNYFSDPRLDKISVQNDNELKNMLEQLKTLSDEDFFKTFGLKDYKWDAYTKT